jgi:transcriptional regulator with XRE-family HTH domain
MIRFKVNSKALWDAMARQNLSQNELADKLGISSGYMSQLVRGTRHPSPQLRRRMMELLDYLTFDELFAGEASDDDR